MKIFLIFLIAVIAKPTTVASLIYMGCYADVGSSRDLGYVCIRRSSVMSIETCIYCCQVNGSYNYAALQNSNQCFCGNSYGRYGTSTACNQRCVGNLLQICGGSLANSVYVFVVDEDSSLPTTVYTTTEDTTIQITTIYVTNSTTPTSKLNSGLITSCYLTPQQIQKISNEIQAVKESDLSRINNRTTSLLKQIEAKYATARTAGRSFTYVAIICLSFLFGLVIYLDFPKFLAFAKKIFDEQKF